MNISCCNLYRSLIVILIYGFIAFVYGLNCKDSRYNLNFQFHLVKYFHRSVADRLHVANVNSLNSCMEVAKAYKGLAFNYKPKDRYLQKDVKYSKISRDHYWKQPQLYFNCHILQCPENSTFKTLINDTQFDYYSLYDKAIAISNYICVPQVGIFMLHDTPETFQNASLQCRTSSDYHCSTLAHIVSAGRTMSLKQAIADYNEKQTFLGIKPKIHLAYVGLYFNRSQQQQRFEIFNMEGDNLKCFSYRSWEPGNPKMSSQFINSSCVALTSHGTWLTVDCKRKLPYFCEIYTKCDEAIDVT